MSNTRPFEKLTDNSIQFSNGNIIEFSGTDDTYINGQLVSIQEFMDYLLSNQYKIDNGYDL